MTFHQKHYLYGSLNRKRSEPAKVAVTACFLSVPLSALMWAIVTFIVAICANAFQMDEVDLASRKLMIFIIVVIMAMACGTFLFFWRTWAPPRNTELEDEFSLHAQPPEPTRSQRVKTTLKEWLSSIYGRSLSSNIKKNKVGSAVSGKSDVGSDKSAESIV
jgi:hypothetical protein